MPEKRKPLQAGQPIRGVNIDNNTVSENGYSGYIPPAAFNALEWEVSGLMHGTASLTVHIKDGHLLRYVTGRERSFILGRSTTGGIHNE